MLGRSLAYAAAVFALAAPASGNGFAPVLQAFLDAELRAWATHDALVSALRDQNAMTAGYGQGAIDALDQAWRAELRAEKQPTIAPILSNPAADFLRQQVAASGGRVTEVILMDAVGLNAAVSHVTTDMWQGDEAKFTQTFPQGAEAVHFGFIEIDASTGRYQSQISFTVVDPATGEPLGAMTVGVDADALL